MSVSIYPRYPFLWTESAHEILLNLSPGSFRKFVCSHERQLKDHLKLGLTTTTACPLQSYLQWTTQTLPSTLSNPNSLIYPSLQLQQAGIPWEFPAPSDQRSMKLLFTCQTTSTPNPVTNSYPYLCRRQPASPFSAPISSKKLRSSPTVFSTPIMSPSNSCRHSP